MLADAPSGEIPSQKRQRVDMFGDCAKYQLHCFERFLKASSNLTHVVARKQLSNNHTMYTILESGVHLTRNDAGQFCPLNGKGEFPLWCNLLTVSDRAASNATIDFRFRYHVTSQETRIFVVKLVITKRISPGDNIVVYAKQKKSCRDSIAQKAVAKAVVTQDASTVVNKDASTVVNTNASPVINKDASRVVNKDASPVINKDASQVVNKDASPVANKDAATVVPKDAATVANKDAATVVPKDAATVINKDASPVANKDASTVASKDAATVATKDAAPVASEDASPVASKDAATVVTKDASPVINKDASPVINKDASTVINKGVVRTKQQALKATETIRPTTAEMAEAWLVGSIQAPRTNGKRLGFPTIDMEIFKLSRYDTKFTKKWIKDNIIDQKLVTKEGELVLGAKNKLIWDQHKVHERLKWNHVVPLLVPGPFICEEIVYRGCVFLQSIARKIGDTADRVKIVNPAYTAAMLFKVRT